MATTSEQGPRSMVIMISHGIEDERSTIGLTIANGSITSGLNVAIFLTSNGVDLARKAAADTTHVHPFEPLQSLLHDFLERGGMLWACAPCCKSRGYQQENLIDGSVITGASPMLAEIQGGAATLSF